MTDTIRKSLTYSGDIGHTKLQIQDAIDAFDTVDLFDTCLDLVTEEIFPEFYSKIIKSVGSKFIKMTTVQDPAEPRDMRMVWPILQFEDCIITIRGFNKAFESTIRHLRLRIKGDLHVVHQVYKRIESTYNTSKSAKIDWIIKDSSYRTKIIPLNLEHRAPLDTAFFPWLKPNVVEFQDSYLKSNSNILLLLGEPGCGKTTFIRDLLHRHNLASVLAYDNEVMQSDSFFIDFLTGDYDLLILEDADDILYARTEGNKTMSKLLNSGDGLIRTKKKIIITANIYRLDDIDEALLRPGRCFDIVNFRELTHLEAIKAAQIANCPEPDGPRTLAQLLGDGPSAKIRPGIGFGAL